MPVNCLQCLKTYSCHYLLCCYWVDITNMDVLEWEGTHQICFWKEGLSLCKQTYQTGTLVLGWCRGCHTWNHLAGGLWLVWPGQEVNLSFAQSWDVLGRYTFLCLKLTLPWLVWLSGLSAGLRTTGSLVWFPVRAPAWVVGRVPSWGRVRGNHTLMFLSLPSCLSRNK